MRTKMLIVVTVALFISLVSYAQGSIDDFVRVTDELVQFDKIEFSVNVNAEFDNPYDGAEVALDMIIETPSGKRLLLPCFYYSGIGTSTNWRAHFAAAEHGVHTYYFRLSESNTAVDSTVQSNLGVLPSAKNGFITSSDFWTFEFSSGKPFRGIGENVGWEGGKYSYNYLLPTIAENGGNFFRTWMHSWNLPLEWKNAGNDYGYSNEYFHPKAIERMDELIELIDSLGLYFMLALDAHVGFQDSQEWPNNNYNSTNGGPVETPAAFFSSANAKAKYKNRLRYLVARWGYSTRIGTWEFFNEVDNAVNSDNIPEESVTNWHIEMSAYLKSIDPFNHLVSTSISHHRVDGLFDVADLDFNMQHSYKQTGLIPSLIENTVEETGKPFVVGEFGYEWDWNLDFTNFEEELKYDYKRGLWYGVFTSTPVMPMTWWWEWFDEKNMTPYLASVREISDQMLDAGNGNFLPIESTFSNISSYAVKCGEKYYSYFTNHRTSDIEDKILIISDIASSDTFEVSVFYPELQLYEQLGNFIADGTDLEISNISLAAKDEKVILIKPAGNTDNINLPFNDVLKIPGLIQTEEFDKGGHGIAYNDFDGVNTYGYFRADEGVDIDTVLTGSYTISNIVDGEWLEYSIRVDTLGIYNVEIAFKTTRDNQSLTFETTGKSMSESIVLPNTFGSWDKINVNIPFTLLGEQTLKLSFEGSGYEIDYMSFTFVNKTPVVEITNPQQDTVIATDELPVDLTITATATDYDGNVESVLFYANDALLGEATSTPYLYEWVIGMAGEYIVTAHAIDDFGSTTISAPIQISVVQNQKPYEGTPYIIPGKIEAENYDIGGQDNAYFDNTPGNKFEEYREDDIDIEVCTDDDGGYSLGDLERGEWLAYTVYVNEAKKYGCEFRVATEQTETKFHIEINDVDVTGTITVPNTGGWQEWNSMYANIEFEEGEQEMKIVIEEGYFNLNYIVFGDVVSNTAAENTSLNIYPNPVGDIVYIENLTNGAKLDIHDVTGRKISELIIENNVLNVTDLQPGLYIAHIYNRNGQFFSSFSLIKE